MPTQPRSYIWHLWPGRCWPFTAEEEAAFVERLRSKATVRPRRGERRHHSRGDITSLLNALRCGIDADALFEAAPGLRPRLLLAAYEDLDGRRKRAIDAFNRIREQRNLQALSDWQAAASVLMAVAVRRMIPSDPIPSDELVAARVERVCAEIDRVCAQAREVEEDLASRDRDDPLAVEIGRRLYDPYDPALWSDPFYLPNRVGDLVPLRVADLLGERRP